MYLLSTSWKVQDIQGLNTMLKEITGYEGLYLVDTCGNVYSILSHKWLTPYDNRMGKYKTVRLFKDKVKTGKRVHRLVALTHIPNPENLPFVDHINQNKWDNSVENLRWCTHSSNNQNRPKIKTKASSIYKGVYWLKSRNRWRATIWKEGKYFFIGTFPVERDAALAYNKAARKFFGEFASINNL